MWDSDDDVNIIIMIFWFSWFLYNVFDGFAEQISGVKVILEN